MMRSFCATLERKLEAEIKDHTEVLVRGTNNREADERARGAIFGLRQAQELLQDLEAQARKAEKE